MGRLPGMVVNVVSLVYIVVTVVFFCFPFVLPVTVSNMNYTSVITVGLMALVALWWSYRGRHEYTGPTYNIETAKRLAGVQGIEKGRRESRDDIFKGDS